MKCPYGGWPDPGKGCRNVATVRLMEIPAPGDQMDRKGMKVTVCEDHKNLYLTAGWKPR